LRERLRQRAQEIERERLGIEHARRLAAQGQHIRLVVDNAKRKRERVRLLPGKALKRRVERVKLKDDGG
jgi:hypothetical protein